MWLNFLLADTRELEYFIIISNREKAISYVMMKIHGLAYAGSAAHLRLFVSTNASHLYIILSNRGRRKFRSVSERDHVLLPQGSIFAPSVHSPLMKGCSQASNQISTLIKLTPQPRHSFSANKSSQLLVSWNRIGHYSLWHSCCVNISTLINYRSEKSNLGGCCRRAHYPPKRGLNYETERQDM